MSIAWIVAKGMQSTPDNCSSQLIQDARTSDIPSEAERPPQRWSIRGPKVRRTSFST